MSETRQAPAAGWKLPFIGLFASQALSLVGSSLVQFALIWWLTATTGSPTVLAMASLAGLLPNVVLAPAAGVLVDRLSRRRVMIAADSLVALVTLGLVVLFAAGRVEVWHVYAALFLRSAAGSFQFPAWQASTSLMVPESHLARVAGFNQMLQGAMNIAAPPLGALLLAVLPMQGVLAIDVLTAALAVGTLALIAIPQPARPAAPAKGEAAGRPTFWADMRTGMRYVTAWPGLLALLLMAVVINLLFSPAAALLPILVTRHFGGGALHLAWLESGSGVGVVAGGLLLGMWGGFKRKMLTTLCGMIGLGLAFGLLGGVPAGVFWLAVALSFVAGGMQPVTNGPIMAVLQASVAPDMQGRVFSLVGALASAMAPVGLVLAAPVAERLGVQSWFFIAGGVCVLMAVVGLLTPAILHLEDGRAWAAAPLAPDAAVTP